MPCVFFLVRVSWYLHTGRFPRRASFGRRATARTARAAGCTAELALIKRTAIRMLLCLGFFRPKHPNHSTLWIPLDPFGSLWIPLDPFGTLLALQGEIESIGFIRVLRLPAVFRVRFLHAYGENLDSQLQEGALLMHISHIKHRSICLALLEQGCSSRS